MTTDASTDHPLTVARRGAGLSMEALAAKAGVSTPTVYRAEHSRHVTKASTRQKLAEALGVDAETLIREDHGTTVPARSCGTPDATSEKTPAPDARQASSTSGADRKEA